MPEYSGVAAVLPQAGPAHEPPAGEQLMGFMERFMQIRNAQKQQATSQLMSTVQMAQQFGFMFDPKQVAKLVKKSGLPISMKDEDITAGLVAHKSGQGDQPSAGPNGLSPNPKDAGQTGASQPIPPGNGQGPRAGGPQSQLSSGERVGMWVNQMAARAQKLMNMKATTDDAKAQNALTIEQLKKTAMGEGPEADKAAGKLITMNELKFDVNANNWYSSDAKGRGKILAMAQGAESDAQKAERGTKLGEAMLTSGRFSSPDDAIAAGKQLAETGVIAPELKSKMRPYSIQEISEQATTAAQFQSMGIPSAQIPGLMRQAEAGGLLNALPPGLKSVGMKQLELQQTEVGIEKGRLLVEGERAAAEMIKAEASARTQAQKDSLDNFKSLVEIKKAGGKVPDQLIDAAAAKLGDQFNMDVTTAKHWYQYVTGGSYQEFTPRLTDKGKSTVDELAGRSKPKASKPSIIQNLLNPEGDKGPI